MNLSIFIHATADVHDVVHANFQRDAMLESLLRRCGRDLVIGPWRLGSPLLQAQVKVLDIGLVQVNEVYFADVAQVIML